MQVVYTNDEFHAPGKFIPIDIAIKQNPSTLEKLIQLQKQYIDNHRSVTVVGVSFELMCQLINDKESPTLQKLVNKCVWINWVPPTSKAENNGRIIFSTTSQNYYSAIEWIETTFLPHHKEIRHRIDPTGFTGLAHRVVRNGQIMKPIDDYTTNLLKTIGPVQTAPSPSSNAWSKPFIIGTNDSFPPLSTNSTSSTNNQQSTSTVDSLSIKIESLTNTIDKLQQQLAIQSEQQSKLLSTIETIIEDKVNKRFQTIHNDIKAIETQYQAIIDQINASWSTKLERIRNDKSIVTNSTPDVPGSGSDRVRKQPRTTTNLDDVQRTLFTNNNSDSTNSIDITIQDESVV